MVIFFDEWSFTPISAFSFELLQACALFQHGACGSLTGEPCCPDIQHGASGSLTRESHNQDIEHGASRSLRGEPHFEYGDFRSLTGQPPFLLALFGSTKFCMTNDFNVRKIALYFLYSIQESFVDYTSQLYYKEHVS